MGRTVPTYHDALEALLLRWEREFGRGLQTRAEEEAFQRLLTRARRHVAQGTLMSTGDLLERVLLSILVDLEADRAPVPPLTAARDATSDPSRTRGGDPGPGRDRSRP